jgi:uncharacterized OB-fold protein
VSTTPVHDGLFDDTANGPRLRGTRCRACTRHHFPASVTCPFCGSADVEAVALSPEGTLWGWTGVTAAPPGYDGPVPFGFGVVELPEGVRVITRLEESDPSRLEFGQPMTLVLAEVGTNDDGSPLITYSFRAAT